MADDNIVLGVEVNAGGGESLASLKKEFRDLNNQLENTQHGTDEYIETMKKLGKTKDNINDLRNEINALNPEGKVAAIGNLGSKLAGGFEAATGAAALFGNKSEELEKSLLKVQAALALQQGIKEVAGLGDAFKEVSLVLKASPLLWIPVAIAAVTAAMFALKDKVKIVGEAFDWISEKVNVAIDAITEFTDWIGLTDSALSEMQENVEKTAKSLEHLSEMTQANYEREIKLAKAAGQDVTDLEIAKQKAMQQTAQMQIESLNNLQATGQTLTDEQQKRKAELVQTVLDTDNEIKVIRLNHQQEERDAYAKHLEEKKKLDQKYIDEQQSLQDKLKEYEAEDRAQNEQILIDKQTAEDAKIADDQQKLLDQSAYNKQVAEDDLAWKQEHEAKQQALNKETRDKYVQGIASGVKDAKVITDFAFDYALKRAKGNAEKEKEIRKKQFNVNKAFGIVDAVINGIGAVQKALNNPYPLNIILAAVSGIAAAVNVAKIASTKFEGGETSGAVEAPNLSGGATAQAPAIPQPNNTVTKINEDGSVNKAPQPVVIQNNIVETDITDKTKQVAKIQETAQIG